MLGQDQDMDSQAASTHSSRAAGELVAGGLDAGHLRAARAQHRDRPPRRGHRDRRVLGRLAVDRRRHPQLHQAGRGARHLARLSFPLADPHFLVGLLWMRCASSLVVVHVRNRPPHRLAADGPGGDSGSSTAWFAAGSLSANAVRCPSNLDSVRSAAKVGSGSQRSGRVELATVVRLRIFGRDPEGTGAGPSVRYGNAPQSRKNAAPGLASSERGARPLAPQRAQNARWGPRIGALGCRSGSRALSQACAAFFANGTACCASFPTRTNEPAPESAHLSGQPARRQRANPTARPWLDVVRSAAMAGSGSRRRRMSGRDSEQVKNASVA